MLKDQMPNNIEPELGYKKPLTSSEKKTLTIAIIVGIAIGIVSLTPFVDFF